MARATQPEQNMSITRLLGKELRRVKYLQESGKYLEIKSHNRQGQNREGLEGKVKV